MSFFKALFTFTLEPKLKPSWMYYIHADGGCLLCWEIKLPVPNLTIGILSPGETIYSFGRLKYTMRLRKAFMEHTKIAHPDIYARKFPAKGQR